MQTIYTVATFTRHASDQESNWREPEIGKAVYGDFINLPPFFRSKRDAEECSK